MISAVFQAMDKALIVQLSLEYFWLEVAFIFACEVEEYLTQGLLHGEWSHHGYYQWYTSEKLNNRVIG